MSVQYQQLPAYGYSGAPYAYGEPESEADFKSRPEDFVVEEVLGFEPSGEGEHLFLLLQTDDHNTRYTVKCLARLFDVRQRQVSYSGLKDRRGLTSQWFSIHLPGINVEPDAQQLAKEGITLLCSGRHHRKLRIGTHKANRFHIVLRNSEPNLLETRLQQIIATGVPNYFGAQRFGHQAGNVEEALEWVEKAELPFDRAQRSRVLSSLRSWWFNGCLARRVEQDSWNQWLPGDPIMLDGSQSYFMEDTWNETLESRFQEGDIHPGSWLPGTDTDGLPEDMRRFLLLANMKPEPRPLRLLPRHVQVKVDGSTFSLSFELPKGAFATTVLRELVRLNDFSPLETK